MNRLSKDEYYLNIALEVSKRSPCKRRHVGAVLVKNDSIISTGYNGPARGAPNCIDYGCLKDKLGLATGQSYGGCRAGPLHGEVNAIINAARENGGTRGSTMYVAGEKNGEFADARPCILCQKEIINAGIEEIVLRKEDGGVEKLYVGDLLDDAKNSLEKDIVDFYSSSLK